MNLLSQLLALTLLFTLLFEAVVFHKATVCRQKAWLVATELTTRGLLHSPKSVEEATHLSCRLWLRKDPLKVQWQRLGSIKRHEFVLPLDGRL